MKKYVFLAIMISIASLLSMSAQEKKGKNTPEKQERMAQRDEERKKQFEEFKAKRVAYITGELNLTEKEAQVFWPVCNELQEKKFELHRANREEMQPIFQKIRNNEPVSDEEYVKMIRANAEIKVKEAELDKLYFERMIKILPIEKVFKYQRAEQRFAQQMIENTRDKNRERVP